jgi:hypothetical protein
MKQHSQADRLRIHADEDNNIIGLWKEENDDVGCYSLYGMPQAWSS